MSEYLQEANQLAESSTDQVAAAIAAFEKSSDYKDFKHIEKARRFKRQLLEYINPDTGRGLAKSTIHSRLMAVKSFFKWLAGQPGYKSRIRYSDADYFNSSANDERIAKAVRERPVPTLNQILHVPRSMPVTTVLERRDRALVAFTLLKRRARRRYRFIETAARGFEGRTVNQDAREVRTKTRKTFISDFFPVGDEVEQIVADWIAELQTNQLFGPDDPLFPSTAIGLNDEGHFTPVSKKLEQCRADPQNLPRCLREGRPPLFQPSLAPQNPRNYRAIALPHTRSAKGMEPEPWP